MAEEARRFRGSAPIGGRDSARESVGTTVGNRRPLRSSIGKWRVGVGLPDDPNHRTPCNASVGRGALTPPPDIVPHPRQGTRVPPTTAPLVKCLRRGTFCHQRQKVPKERRQNQWFWNPCAGTVRKVSGPFDPANKTVQTRPVLSHCLRFYPPRCAPRLCCLGITGLPPASTVRRDVGIAPYEILSSTAP